MFRQIRSHALQAGLVALAAIGVLAVTTSSASAATYKWIDGPKASTWVWGCVSGLPDMPIESTVGYVAEVGSDGMPNGNYPKTGDAFYVHIVVSDVTLCEATGHAVTEEISLPAGTVPAVSANDPIECFELDYGTNTNRQVTVGCPTSVSRGSGHQLDFALGTRPVYGGHDFEIRIPVRAYAPLNGLSSSSQLRGLSTGTWGTLWPTAHVYVTSDAPSVSYPSRSATAITQTSARLNATVTKYNTSGPVYFDIGRTTSYGATRSAGTLPSEGEVYDVWFNFSGLSPGTTYHWRVRYVTGGHVYAGADQSFRTAADRTPPAISSLTLSPARFKAARKGPSILARGGATVRLALSERATVTFTVRKRNAMGRWVAVRGSFLISAAKGSSHIHFSGRVGGASLKPGAYQLLATARDAAGNRSKQASVRFTIVR